MRVEESRCRVVVGFRGGWERLTEGGGEGAEAAACGGGGIKLSCGWKMV